MFKFEVEFKSYKDVTEGYPKIFTYLASSETSKKQGTLVRIDVDRDESKQFFGKEEEDIYFPKGLHFHNFSMPLDKENHDSDIATFEVEDNDAWGVWKFLMALGTHGNGGHSFELCIGDKWLMVDGDGADWLISINGAKENKWKKIDQYHYDEYSLDKNEEEVNDEVNESKHSVKITQKQLMEMIQKSIKKTLC